MKDWLKTAMILWKKSKIDEIEAYSESCLASKIQLSTKTVKGFQSLTTFAKGSTFDVWRGSEYASVNNVS